MTLVARHLSISGHVQGVFFRAWSRDRANALGVRGWVRNCPDGHVEAHVEGEEAGVDAMIDCLRTGPPKAKVEGVRIWDAQVCDFDDFEVRH